VFITKQLVLGGYWSVYWHNGSLYGTEIAAAGVSEPTCRQMLATMYHDAITIIRT